MKKALQRVILGYVSLFSLLLNMLQPLAYATLVPARVMAEEATTSASPAESTPPEPSLEPSPAPIEDISPIDLIPSPLPSIEPITSPAESTPPEPSITPTPSIEPYPSVEPSISPSAEPSISPSPSTSPEIIPATTPTPAFEETKGSLNIAILPETSASSIDEFDLSISESGSATLVTDKADYAPTDTALITGSGYEAGDSYLLSVWSDDEPATRSDVTVIADESGNIIYAYQLDGTYRPNYKVEAKAQSGRVVATTTFTDAPPITYTAESYSDNTYSTVKNTFYRGQTVYGKGTRSQAANIRLRFRDASNNVVQTCGYVNNTVTTCNYSLPGNAQYGEWDIQLGRCDDKCNKEDNWVWDRYAIDHFTVAQIQHTSVTFCHATPPDTAADGYQKLTVDDDAIFQQGHSGQHGADIIPPFTYYGGSFAGKNWPAGKAIYDNNCVVPQPPKLTVTKIVKNDNGGTLGVSAFPLFVNGNSVNSGEEKTYSAGTSYTISETQQAGYAQSGISCDSGKTNPVVLNNGDDVHCTVTNDDIPGTLRVTKVVSGGNKQIKDFSYTLTGQSFNFVEGGQSFNMNAGTYSVVENNDPLYTVSYSADCSGTMALADSKTCTVTNTRKFGLLFIDKILVGNGPALPSDWTFTVRSLTGSVLGTLKDNGGSLKLDTGSYRVSESSIVGYSLTAVGGVCAGTFSNPTATVSEGNNTCTFENTRDTGSVLVHKAIDTDGDGDYYYSDQYANNLGIYWKLDGYHSMSMGYKYNNVETTISPSTIHSLTETPVAGYHYTGWFRNGEHGKSCERPNGTNYPVEVSVSKNTTTEITLCNARDMGTITIVKDAKPNSHTDFDFRGDLGSFSIDDEGYGHNSRTFNVPVGTYNVTERGEDGWYLSNITCNDGNSQTSLGQSLVSISLEKGEHVTCNFENTKYGRIEGYKYHDENGDGNWDYGEGTIRNWEIYLSGNDAKETDTTSHHGSYSFDNLKPGIYTVCEQEKEGWYSRNDLCRTTTITAGDTDRIDFGNYQKAILTVKKDVVTASGAPVVDDSTGFTFNFSGSQEPFVLYDQDANDNNYQTFVVDPGSYSLTEEENSNYDFAGCRVIGEHDHHHDDWCSRSRHNDKKDNLSLKSGESLTVICTNKQKTGDLEVVKFNDINGDGQFDRERETTLYGWEIQVSGQDKTLTQVTEEDGGSTIFRSLLLGWYDLSENMTTEQEGSWRQTGLSCDGSYEGSSVYVAPGTTTTCYIGNQQKPLLTLTKTNDATGDKSPGSKVTYTLVVKLTGSDLSNVILTDLPPHGFKYQSGSYLASSHVVSEPTYASPGKWTIGEMKVADEITLSYVVDIDNSVDSGKYPDLAWIAGDSSSWGKVYGNSIDPSIFVGTSVSVVKNETSGTNVNVEKEGEVLGAATELPATGADTRYLILALVLTALGLLLTVGKKYMYKLFGLTIALLAIFGFAVSPAHAEMSNLIIKLEEPRSPGRTQNLDISYTVLDTENSALTVRCYGKKEGGSFVQFGGDQSLIAGGNSGLCTTNSSVIGDKAKYEFYATASSGEQTVESNHVTYSFDNDSPSTPTFSKDRPSSCRYVIKFHSSNDNQTRYIEIYRSQNRSFNADNGTRVGTVNIEPDEDGQFVHDFADECNKDWYYAIRAFDEAGNGSNVVGDTVTINTAVSSSTAPAIALSVGSILGKKTAAPSSSPEGEILGDDSKYDATVSGDNLVSQVKDKIEELASNKGWLVVLIVAVAISLLYTIYYVIKAKSQK